MTLEGIRWKPLDYEVVTDYNGDVIVKRSDGASIPCDPRNSDYYEFLQVEKSDAKSVIKRTTIKAPETVDDPMIALKSRIDKLETELATLKSTTEKIG
jgi:ribosome-associated translation inhibitor RaiA